MILLGVYAEDLPTKDCIYYIRDCMSDYIVDKINRGKLEKFKDYFESMARLQSIYVKQLDPYEIIVCGADNLIVEIFENRYSIEIDENVTFPRTDTNLEMLCRIINDGVADIPPYDIFQQASDYFMKNLDKIIEIYKKERM